MIFIRVFLESFLGKAVTALLSEIDYSEMLKENFDTHKNEYDSACKLCFGFEFRSENITDFNTDCRKNKGCCTDEADGGTDIDLGEESKRDSDGKSINACSSSNLSCGASLPLWRITSS